MYKTTLENTNCMAVVKSPLILENELEVSCPPTQHGLPYLEFGFQQSTEISA